MSALNKNIDPALLKSISTIIFRRGLKATTMDGVASSLGMSKRTLYEIFGSKKDMILHTVKYWQAQHHQKAQEIFSTAPTIMEAMFLTFKYHLRFMRDVNVEVLRDMDREYREIRDQFENRDGVWGEALLNAINVGIEQGVFRPDLNYKVMLPLMRIQMESLKRMEEFFPADITIAEAFDAIGIGFLRSIASQEGMKILDEVIRNSKPDYSGLLN